MRYLTYISIYAQTEIMSHQFEIRNMLGIPCICSFHNWINYPKRTLNTLKSKLMWEPDRKSPGGTMNRIHHVFRNVNWQFKNCMYISIYVCVCITYMTIFRNYLSCNMPLNLRNSWHMGNFQLDLIEILGHKLYTSLDKSCVDQGKYYTLISTCDLSCLTVTFLLQIYHLWRNHF